MTSTQKKILVVDDTEGTRYFVARVLRDHGYEVLEAATGQKTLEVALHEQPDVVVLDVKLPDLHGFEVAARLKANPLTRSILVLHLSAVLTDAGTRAEGLVRGADAFLTHPVEPQVLCATVGALLRLREAEQQEKEAHEQLQRGAEERERLIARLQEEDRRKTEFLAMLSHELRNPLTPILNSVSVLERAVPGGEQSRHAREVIERQAQHLARLVNDLLDVTRISSGKVRLQLERVDLADVARKAADDMRELFRDRGVDLTLDIASGPVFVDGDRVRLGQAIANLLRNAAKFTPRGASAELGLHGEGGQAVVWVRDQGLGIHPDLLPRLFEPFVQADRTLDRSEGGLGLGLALVKSLIELHRGTVTAESEGAGRGARFTIRLPLAQGAGDGAADAVSARPAIPHRRVLVVEDNEDVAQSLSVVLQQAGHAVQIASDGARALAVARAFRPDVVVCDIGLPGMDGYEVAAALRADADLHGACLVALSGYAQKHDVERALGAGFDHHLTKPPDLAVLQQLICESTASLA